MSEIKKIIRQCVSDFNYLANRQIGVLESNDEDLGFIPWGGKDAEGNITVFLSKDKPGILSTLKITEIADGNAGIIQYDADGQLSGLADLNLLADVEITDPSNLQGLIFNSDNSKWENQDIITYGLTYKGTWNADTNNPELLDAGGGGIKGDLYIVNVEGTTEIDGISDWKVKDWIVNCGETWEKVDNTEIVYTFDLVYDNESGVHLITIDDGSMRWAIDGDYDFNIDLTDAEASRGFKVYDASNSFQIIKEPLSSLYLIGELYNVNINSSHGSRYMSTSSPLELRTFASGDIYITSAGSIDIDAISNIDIDGTGFFDVQVTGIVSIDGSGNSNFSTWDGNLTISTMSTGSLILTSIALVDLNAGANLDIDVTGTFDMLSTGVFSIDGTGASNVSATSGNLTISTITSGVLYLTSAGFLAFTDGYKAASGYGTDLVLSDSAAEWDTYETNFGEVSILNALNQCVPLVVTLDVAYDNSGGISQIDVDAGNVIWSLTNSCFFTVSLDGDPTWVGFQVLDGTDNFVLKHSAADTLILDADLSTFDISSAGVFSIDGVGASNLSVTSGDLTISTITSGVLYLTSAGLLTLSDGFKAGSTYSTDLVLSDSNAEWNTFESNFGEVSLLNAINQCVAVAPTVPTLDEAYEESGGVSSITIDLGNVVWYPTGANDFYIRVNDATDGHGFVVDHYIPPNGSTTHFSLLENADQLALTSRLKSFSLYGLAASSISVAGLFDLNADANFDIDVTGTFEMDSTGAFSIDGTGASNVSATSGNLTISTITTGSLIATSAGLFDLNAGANLDIDVTGTFDMLSTGAFSIDGTGASNVSATSGDLTISTITSGTLILLSAGVVDIDGSDITIDGTAGLSIDVATASNITISGATADLTLGARGATITLNQSGNTSLSGFTATSIIGALNEVKTASYSSSYAEMYMSNNTTACVNENVNISILTRLWTTGSLSGWTFVAGIAGSITAYSNYGGTVAGTVRVASTAHGLTTGDYISIRGTTNYNGVFQITKISNDAFYFYATWVSDDGASDWDRGSYLLAGANAAGTYLIKYCATITIANYIASDIRTLIYKNGTADNKTIARETYISSSSNDYHNIEGQGIISIAVGDKIFFAVSCTNAAANPTITFGSVVLNRI